MLVFFSLIFCRVYYYKRPGQEKTLNIFQCFVLGYFGTMASALMLAPLMKYSDEIVDSLWACHCQAATSQKALGLTGYLKRCTNLSFMKLQLYRVV